MNIDQLLPHDISHRLRLLDVLDRITQVGLASDNMEDVMRGVLDLVLEVFNADRAWFLYPCDPDALSWGIPMERVRPEWPGLFAQGMDIPMSRGTSELFSELLKTNGTIQYAPNTGHPVPQLIAEHYSVKSQLMIALRPKIGKAWAFGLHHCASEVVHDEKALHLFTAVAQRISDSLSSLISIRQQRESEAKYRLLIESLQEGIWMIDKNACTSFVNQRMAQMLGYSVEEMQGKHLFSFMDERGKEIATQNLERRKQEISEQHDFEFLRKDGSRIYTSMATSPILDEAGNYAGALAGVMDVTERRQIEEELRLRAQLLDSTSDSVFANDFDGNFIYLNEAAWKTRGYTRDEMMGTNLHVLDTPKYEKLIESRMRGLMENGQSIFESEHRRKDGSAMPIEVSARIIESGGRKLVISTVRDITERKQAEAEIQHANRALATLSAVNHNLVHATDVDKLLQTICQTIVQQRGYRLAWVGYVQHDENKSVKIMAYASNDGGYPDTMQPTWAEDEQGLGPCGRAVRSGVTQLSQDIANDPLYLPWRDEAFKRGYAASIALPLLNGDQTVFGTLTVYAAEANAFIPAEVALLEEMAGDLAFGVRSLHTRQERDLALEQSRQHLERLQNSLEDTVRAIATIVEMRDPYTSGHQVRVADLAMSIARQMGLPEEQVHTIHLAGVVHDLGKIQIPAEILSKPGKISEIEFSLIKIHPQASYDILKGIDFPWPIAQMVLQHHERLNGSGYPQGLKGDAILLEARILSVADVVEAMSSHRPYRPGLGIEVALAEITRLRGIHFDPAVVDACLALFREQHYSFKT